MVEPATTAQDVSKCRDRGAQRGQIQVFPQQQEFGAPAVVGIGIILLRVHMHRLGAGVCRAWRRPHDGLATEERADAFQQIDEAPRPGIDDARLQQYRQLLRRVRQRLARHPQRMRKPRLDVMHLFAMFECLGERRDHTQHGALARLGDRFACGSRTCAHRQRQLARRHRHPIADMHRDAG